MEKEFKAKSNDLRKNKCEVCNSEIQLVLHHKDLLKYRDKNYFDEKRNVEKNIVTLCKSCHSKFHIGLLHFNKKNKVNKEILELLVKVGNFQKVKESEIKRLIQE